MKKSALYAIPEVKVDTKSRSLLCKEWQYSIPITIAIYVVMQILLGLDHAYNPNPVCNQHVELPYWIWLINFSTAVSFVLNFFLTINRMMVTRGQHSEELFCSLAANLTVTVIAGSSQIMTLVWDYGGICRDYFGVLSPGTQWPEWMTSVPFLIYTAVAVEDKARLTLADWAVVIGMFIVIFTGYLLLYDNQPYSSAMALLVISCVFVGVTVYTVLRAQHMYRKAMAGETVARLGKAQSLAIATQQKNLSILLLVAVPILPVIYFLNIGKLMDDNVQYASTMIMSMMVKLIFASMAAEGHIKATEDTMNELEAEAGDAREAEAFAEHLFHKVSLPLNAVIVGLEVLGKNVDNRNQSEVESINSLRESTSYISEALNQLVHADKKTMRTQDALRLNTETFVMNDMIMRILIPAQKKLATKFINCKLIVSPQVPKKVIGDKLRLEYVLTTLLESGIAASPIRSKMTLEVSSKPIKTGPDVVKHVYAVTFEITRNAPLTADEEMILNKGGITSTKVTASTPSPITSKQVAPSTVKPEVEGEGHRGLKLSREIVILHGGNLVCRSSLKAQAAIGFCIPFESEEIIDTRASMDTVRSIRSEQQETKTGT